MINLQIQNLDLISVGVAIAAIGILGVVVYLNNHKSITNKTFLLFAFVTIAYGVINYISYQVSSSEITIWLLRLTIFSAVWHAFSFFQLFYVFPDEQKVFPPKYKSVLVPVVFIVSLLTLTPFVFSNIATLGDSGQVSRSEPGPAIAIFGLTVTILVIGGGFNLFRKTIKSNGAQRNQFILVLIGTLITFSCIIVFNFILPVVFEELNFIPLAPVFFLPFIILTSYAIVKYRLLNVKVIATEILTFFLAVGVLFEVLISRDIGTAIFRFLIFCLVLVFGLMLIRSVIKEVKQRELLQVLTRKLETANKQLKILDAARAEFITMASHQLRSPPSGIKWYLSALLADEFGKVKGELRSSLVKINVTNNAQISLIDALLNVSRIERGKLEFVFEKGGDLTALTDFTVEQLRPIAEDKKLELVFNKPAKPIPAVIMDKEKLRQVINNMVDNAIKYTRKGKVEVNVEATDTDVILKVKDSGKGMKDKELENTFAKYGRGKDSIKYSAGLGLGMYLAKVIVEQHNGKIWAESPGANQGSTFFFSIPINNKIKPTSLIFDLTKNQDAK